MNGRVWRGGLSRGPAAPGRTESQVASISHRDPSFSCPLLQHSGPQGCSPVRPCGPQQPPCCSRLQEAKPGPLVEGREDRLARKMFPGDPHFLQASSGNRVPLDFAAGAKIPRDLCAPSRPGVEAVCITLLRVEAVRDQRLPWHRGTLVPMTHMSWPDPRLSSFLTSQSFLLPSSALMRGPLVHKEGWTSAAQSSLPLSPRMLGMGL